jgi:adenine-specific DNA-methyltransferase
MLSTGIRGKNGQILEFARIEPLGGTRWLHAEAESKDGKKAVISFGPDYAPLEQRQVELAVEEAQELVPKPKLVIFASFQFDPEAAKDLEELKWPGVDVLKVQMNTDLLTSDLKKKRASNESFWLIGQPDVEIKRQGSQHQITVNGFDYYNTRTGAIESGDASRIAMWELDTDYDGRSLYPRQVFFPMSGSDEGWSKLAKNLKSEIDEELIEMYRGNKSLPFPLGDNKQVAVKIIDDRGIESLKVVKVRE